VIFTLGSWTNDVKVKYEQFFPIEEFFTWMEVRFLLRGLTRACPPQLQRKRVACPERAERVEWVTKMVTKGGNIFYRMAITGV
jgi:hypothetical protein